MRKPTKQASAIATVIATAIGKYAALSAVLRVARKYDRKPSADTDEYPTYAAVLQDAIDDLDASCRINRYPAEPAMKAFTEHFCRHYELEIKTGNNLGASINRLYPADDDRATKRPTDTE